MFLCGSKKHHQSSNYMGRLLLLFFFSCIAFTSGADNHPFWVSITEIAHQPKNQTLEISIKFFTEDLEQALNTVYSKKFYLNESKEAKDANEKIKAYLAQHFALSVNHAAVKWNYIGKEKEDDATWIYLEVEKVKTLSHISIKQSALTELHESQNNIVHVAVGGKRKTLMLNREKPTGEVQF